MIISRLPCLSWILIGSASQVVITLAMISVRCVTFVLGPDISVWSESPRFMSWCHWHLVRLCRRVPYVGSMAPRMSGGAASHSSLIHLTRALIDRTWKRERERGNLCRFFDGLKGRTQISDYPFQIQGVVLSWLCNDCSVHISKLKWSHTVIFAHPHLKSNL